MISCAVLSLVINNLAATRGLPAAVDATLNHRVARGPRRLCETMRPTARTAVDIRRIRKIPMKNLALAIVLAAAAFAAPHIARAQAATAEPLDRIVAVVDEDVVLQSELAGKVNQVMTQYASTPQQLPPRDVLERQVLDRLILQKLQLSRADSNGVKVSDAEVDQALTGLAAQNKMDLSQLRMAVQQQGMDYEQFRRSVRDELLVQRLRQRVVQSRVQVSDAEVETLLKNGTLHRGQLHLGYILVSVPDGATPEQIETARKKADDTKQQIDGGMDFAAAAIRYSDAPNALEGGDLGWRNADEFPQAFTEASDKLQEGQVSAPIRGPNGFHIIKLLGKRADSGAQLVTEYHAQKKPLPLPGNVWSAARTSPKSPSKARRTPRPRRLAANSAGSRVRPTAARSARF